MLEGTHAIEEPADGDRVSSRAVPLRRAANALLQESYIEECKKSVDRWNQTLENAGLDDRLFLPSSRFNRKIGPFAGHAYGPEGAPTDDRTVRAALPSPDDSAYLQALQRQPVLERGKVAQWLAPPTSRINGQPHNFEYVRQG